MCLTLLASLRHVQAAVFQPDARAEPSPRQNPGPAPAVRKASKIANRCLATGPLHDGALYIGYLTSPHIAKITQSGDTRPGGGGAPAQLKIFNVICAIIMAFNGNDLYSIGTGTAADRCSVHTKGVL